MHEAVSDVADTDERTLLITGGTPPHVPQPRRPPAAAHVRPAVPTSYEDWRSETIGLVRLGSEY